MIHDYSCTYLDQSEHGSTNASIDRREPKIGFVECIMHVAIE